MNRRLHSAALAALALLAPTLAAQSEEALSIERRLGRTARYLSSDELGGRGIGTPGISLAKEYIHREFESIGLRTNLFDGGPFQQFEVILESQLAAGAKARLVSPDGEPANLTVGESFNPLAIGGDGEFDLPLLFVGYGITAPEAAYDDYAGVDATGKAVVVLRHDPQRANPHSALNGADNSEHAPFSRKVSNAAQHGAAAVIFVTDRYEIDLRVEQAKKRLAVAEAELKELDTPAAQRTKRGRALARVEEYRRRVEAEQDPLLDFTWAGGSTDRELPVLNICRAPLDALLAAAGKPSLDELETRIDKHFKPQSFGLADCRIAGGFKINRETAKTANVVAVLDGEGPLASEAVVIGAHYDHLGRGGRGSAMSSSRDIHNGADDNASGVAALIETARRLASLPERPKRTIVFIAFSGEERGLLGSAHYVNNPVVTIEQTVAMLNFDMVGRLTDNKLIANGTGTAAEFDAWLDELNSRYAFQLSKSPGGYGPSDHSSFYAKQIPVLHLFTGSHPEYHRPDDDFDLLNIEGMQRVTGLAADMALKIANAPQRVSYVEVEQPRMATGAGDPRPYFGSIPDFAGGAGGYAISGVAPKSPAARGGLVGGDKIVKLGNFQIANLEDFDSALRKFAAGDKVKVVAQRGDNDQEVQLEVVLDPPR